MLDEGAIQRVAEALPKRCWVCRGRSFTIAQQFCSLVTHPVTRGETVLLAPLVAARCDHCGLVLLFAPDALGIEVSEPRRG